MAWRILLIRCCFPSGHAHQEASLPLRVSPIVRVGGGGCASDERCGDVLTGMCHEINREDG